MSRVESFAPLSAPDARVLILGSMPGTASLAAGEYYAHPRNAFWSIIEAVFGIRRDRPYAQRCRQLVGHGVAVWDVLAQCRRPGSLDASIERDSMVVNDFDGFLAAHPGVARICFNGATAEQVFRRRVLSASGTRLADIALLRLPSTSPAHAAMSVAQKVEHWQAALLCD